MTHGLLVIIELPATNRAGAARYARHIEAQLQTAYSATCTVTVEPITGQTDKTDPTTMTGLIRAAYRRLADIVTVQNLQRPRAQAVAPIDEDSLPPHRPGRPRGGKKSVTLNGVQVEFTAAEAAMVNALRALAAQQPGELIPSRDIYAHAMGNTGATPGAQQGYVRKVLHAAQDKAGVPLFVSKSARNGGYLWVHKEAA